MKGSNLFKDFSIFTSDGHLLSGGGEPLKVSYFGKGPNEDYLCEITLNLEQQYV